MNSHCHFLITVEAATSEILLQTSSYKNKKAESVVREWLRIQHHCHRVSTHLQLINIIIIIIIIMYGASEFLIGARMQQIDKYSWGITLKNGGTSQQCIIHTSCEDFPFNL
jgi:hypothetical protein